MKFREPFNAISHLTGAIAALFGSIVLMMSRTHEITSAVALAIYSISLVGLFSASGIYHGVTAKVKTMNLLRKLDHSAIYLLIAGTYTPFCLIAFEGFWRWGMLAIIWSLAVIGIVLKVFIINTPRWLTAGVYIIMGWLCVFGMGEIFANMTMSSIGWLLAGGILYTVGAVIYITRKGNFFPGVFGFHEIWHLFVLMGASAHFMAISSIL